MNPNILKQLVKIANDLDKNSFYDEADALDSIIKKAIAVKQELTFKKPEELKDYQKEELISIFEEADAHEEFSESDFIKRKKHHARMIVFLWGDDVAGFMIPRKESNLGKNKNKSRIESIFVSKNFRALGITQRAKKLFESQTNSLPPLIG